MAPASESYVDAPGGRVTARYDGPADAEVALVFAPGAGADLHHEFMEHVARVLAGAGILVQRFNFPYAEKGRRSPDPQGALESTYRAAADALKTRTKAPVVLSGKSMGGRIASHLVAGGYECDGLIFFGYPLHPPGKPDRLRDEHLYGIATRMLFIEGSRDPFCPLDTLARVRARIPSSDLAVIDDGDHSFRVRKTSGRATSDAWDEVATAASEWARRIVA
jgi:uncharacterized protein